MEDRGAVELVAVRDPDGVTDPQIEEGNCTVRIEDLPPLNARGEKYRSQALVGVGIVSCICISLTFGTHAFAAPPMRKVLLPLIWLWSSLAFAGVAYILGSSPGVIERSPSTCYPIHEEVLPSLLEKKKIQGMGNLRGPSGDSTMGSYCVRCFVWRPLNKFGHIVHHCNICQRCVIGFDHHCDFYGRCIVAGNMFAFRVVIAMFPTGLLTFVVAMLTSRVAPAEANQAAFLSAVLFK
uniref:Palmitoyltransferase n=1 Tax=Noctiluca scintillans TaxID=2966 RepID=A0A7S1FGI6_NOCSC